MSRTNRLKEMPPPEEVASIARFLIGTNANRRADAEDTLQRLGPDVIPPLLGLWEREERARKQRQYIFLSLLALQVVGAAVFIRYGTLAHFFLTLLFALAWSVCLGFIYANLSRPSTLQDYAAVVIGYFRDPRAIGPLLDGLRHLDVIALVELSHLLPLLQPGDDALLKPRHRRRINRLLNRTWRTRNRSSLRLESGMLRDFTLAALTALGRIGDPSSLPAVRRLAAMEVQSTYQQRLRDAAQECLTLLLQRAERKAIRG